MRITKQSTIANGMASCVLPEDVIKHCILTRLPVKSIFRCKSVCKHWLEFLSSPEFIQLHHAQFSKNQSFIIHTTHYNGRNTISLLSIEYSDKYPTIPEHPFNPHSKTNFDILLKIVPPSKTLRVDERVSLGFGYDAETNDYKVVSTACMSNRRKPESWVEVYSVNSDSWRIIDPGFRFSVFRVKSDVSVNGNPYWLAKFDEDEVLVCFDVSKSVFKILSMLTLYLEAKVNVKLVDWNGRLGALCCTKEKEGVITSLDAWVFDEGEEIWRKEHTIKPVEASVDMFLQFTKNGGILGVRFDGELIVLNLESGCVERVNNVKQGEPFEIYEHTECLVYIEGMICASVASKMIDNFTQLQARCNWKRKSSDEVLIKQEFRWRRLRLIRERR
ncbi:hypothetical protein CASFOL_027853 [Castilleja foliolosa]|uniref:F-box domain-containing protein n=1 Tax=Castilleja foliolosa TaxID=1961234 RepID=A0ABD3CH37_9LAMI